MLSSLIFVTAINAASTATQMATQLVRRSFDSDSESNSDGFSMLSPLFCRGLTRRSCAESEMRSRVPIATDSLREVLCRRSLCRSASSTRRGDVAKFGYWFKYSIQTFILWATIDMYCNLYG